MSGGEDDHQPVSFAAFSVIEEESPESAPQHHEDHVQKPKSVGGTGTSKSSSNNAEFKLRRQELHKRLERLHGRQQIQ